MPRSSLHSDEIPREERNWSGQNYGGYRNAEMDVLTHTIPEQLDVAERRQMWRRLQAIYAEDLPAIPLWFRADAHVWPQWLDGVRPTGHLKRLAALGGGMAGALMARILATRLAQIALTLAILSFCAFALIALMPGDPIEVAIAGDPRLTSEDAQRMRALHGLDRRPFHERYFAWAGGLLRGEFGYSRLFARPVAALLGPALLSTLALAGSALLIALTLGVALGALAAARPRSAPASMPSR